MVSDENHIDPYDRLNGVFELQFHNLDVHNLPKCICNLSGGTEKYKMQNCTDVYDLLWIA